jgi:DNA-binding transcriptional LysR family regulator
MASGAVPIVGPADSPSMNIRKIDSFHDVIRAIDNAMVPVNLAAYDLNLLVAFEALYQERHVSRAGTRVGLSQPSMSHALKRLRELFGDNLFDRREGTMIPTARAEELARDLLPGLGLIRAVISEGSSFDAHESKRSFSIGLTDVGSFLVLPRLMPALRLEAPSTSLSVVNVGARDAIEHLLAGTVELACGIYHELPASIESHRLNITSSMCISDRRNPRLAGRNLDIEAFLELSHVRIAVNDDPGAAIDAELASLSLRRHIALSIPHFLAVPGAIIGTDMLAVVDTDSLQAFRHWPELRIDPVPIPIPDLGISVIWHRRSTSDPGHKWLREKLTSGFAAEGTPAPSLAQC